MKLQNIIPIDFANQRVMTYAQVAHGLDCSVDQLRSLYKTHKDEFQETVHFFNVTGDLLRTLKKDVSNQHVDSPLSFAKGAKALKLWTCQGVARLSKLIDTPEAWELFTALERVYFGVAKEEPVEVVEVAPTVIKEEVIVRLKKQIAKPCADLAVVYALLMGDGTVKIGMTKDLTARIKQLKAETKLDVLDFYSSRFMSRDDAAALEAALKEKFSADCLGGEFFDVKFTLVAADL